MKNARVGFGNAYSARWDSNRMVAVVLSVRYILALEQNVLVPR